MDIGQKINALKNLKKYKTVKEFYTHNNSCYTIASRRGWLKEFTWLIREKKINGYWTYERCEEESKKYKSRSEFKKGCLSAYQISIRRKWMDDFTWIRDYKTLDKDKVDCIYVYKFTECRSVYVGRTVNRVSRDYDHRNNTNDSVYKFSLANSIDIPEIEIIEDKITIKRAIEREGYWVEYFKNEGWNIINVAKTGSVGGIASGKWSYESCKQEASRYKNRSEFRKQNGSAYEKSRLRGWLDDFFPQLDSRRAVKKYDLEGNFITRYDSVSEAAKDNNILGFGSGICAVCKR